MIKAFCHDGAGKDKCLLILSDGKPGHVNQSIAFARLLDMPYTIVRVRFRNRLCKVLSYLFDRVGLLVKILFYVDGDLPDCCTVVSAGSDTYYANKVISKAMNSRSVAIMLPRSYRYDFDLIIAQEHDQPPFRDNLLMVPVNLSFPEPKGLVSKPENKLCVSIIIGGPSRHYHMDINILDQKLQQIYKIFPDADFMATTSRRTPKEVEALVDNGPFRYRVIASREDVNPIPDFLAISDFVFVTEDSTSMISEAVSYGKACVEVLPLQKTGKAGKVTRMLDGLQKKGCLHFFDGAAARCNRKVDLKEKLLEACQ